MNWEDTQVSIKIWTNCRSSYSREEENKCSANFRKFPGIQPLLRTILVKLQIFISQFR